MVAVIILNWNGAKLLEKFLPSVIDNTTEGLGQLIVADNGSSDDSLRLLREKFPQVQVISFDENHGFAEGYNRAIAQTNCRYTVLLNSDVEVGKHWLEPLVDAMDDNPAIGACQPKILSYTNPHKFEYAGASGGFLDRNGFPYCRGRIFGTTEMDKGQYDTIIPIFWASGAALMIRTELYKRVGGLDSRFFAHMEEIDLCWRVQLAGYQVVAVPSSVVYHLGGGSLPASDPRKTYLNFRNNLLLLHKNLPKQHLKGALLRRRLLDTLAWAKFMATFSWKNASAVFRAHRDFRKMRKFYNDHPTENLLRRPMSRVNILTAHYIRGISRFSRLPH